MPDNKMNDTDIDNENVTGIVFDIQRYSLGDGSGIRTSIFMKGCNLRCRWCQNPESLKMEPEPACRKERCIQCGACLKNSGEYLQSCPARARYMIGRKYSVKELLSEVLRDKIFYDQSGGGVTVTGGEATLQFEFLYAFLKACKNSGIHTAIETNGNFGMERFSRLLPYIDHVFFDIKMISPVEHKLYTSADNGIILDNARWMALHFDNITFRTPVIPGMTFTKQNMLSIASFLSDLKVGKIELCLYHNSWEKKLTWLESEQVGLNLTPVMPKDVVWIVEIYKSFGITTKLI